ncbi:MAG: hypothetical protein AAB654_12535 [Acidobacteriota bacterium]
MAKVSGRTFSLPAAERWLRDEVAPILDAMKADPNRKLSAKSIFSEARARCAAQGAPVRTKPRTSMGLK